MNVPEHAQLKNAKYFEEILCLATLVATKTLPYSATIYDAREYFENDHIMGDCNMCPFNLHCLGCIING